ncbi:MAG: PfkB family carbohydrate kinase [SAR324 cluster bacterium]|nr:PfkB family carbohydrate kinase [SAR324 cluster bacterium]
MVEFCIVGHVTKDLIKINGREKRLLGGVAYYTSIALSSLGAAAKVISRFSELDGEIRATFEKEGMEITNCKSVSTTEFENIYPENSDARIQRVAKRADPFQVSDVTGVKARVYHFGPLLRGDIPLEVIQHLSGEGRISLDVQGYLRTIEKGAVKFEWDEGCEVFQYVDILKANELEALAISGEKVVEKAAERISQYGIDEIIITRGRKGSVIYYRNELHVIPSFPAEEVVDITGAGDTYMAGYLCKRLNFTDIREAGEFAAAMASLKVAHYGPFKGNEQDVYRHISCRKSKMEE